MIAAIVIQQISHGMNNDLSFGQQRDNDGLVMSWFTPESLEVIKKMDFSDKIVFVWGAGLGDCWLAKRCKELHIVERVNEWIYKSQELLAANGITNVKYYHRPCNEGSGAEEMYCAIPDNVKPDVFIVDDAYRYECILKAIEMKPCTLIVDNFMQAFVFMCPAAVEALKPYKYETYECAAHTDHDGVNKWKTLIGEIK